MSEKLIVVPELTEEESRKLKELLQELGTPRLPPLSAEMLKNLAPKVYSSEPVHDKPWERRKNR